MVDLTDSSSQNVMMSLPLASLKSSCLGWECGVNGTALLQSQAIFLHSDSGHWGRMMVWFSLIHGMLK